VVLVLDDVEHVEQRHPLRRVDLVLAERTLARPGVDAPDLHRKLHQPLPTDCAASTTVDAAGRSTSTVDPKSDSCIVSRMWARIAWFVYAFVVKSSLTCRTRPDPSTHTSIGL